MTFLARLTPLALVAALAFTTAACDSGEDEVTTVTITRASITDLPFPADEDQFDDLYLRFRLGGATIRDTRSDAERVRVSDLPYDFDFGDDIDLVDLSLPLTIEARNREGNQADDTTIATTTGVTLQSLADATPGSRSFSSSNGAFEIRLTLEYD